MNERTFPGMGQHLPPPPTTTYIYLLAVLYVCREILAGKASMEIPQHDDPLLIANQQPVVVCGTELKTLN